MYCVVIQLFKLKLIDLFISCTLSQSFDCIIILQCLIKTKEKSEEKVRLEGKEVGVS